MFITERELDMVELSFNADSVIDKQLAEGTYEAVIVDSSMEETKSGGQYLKLKFCIASGEYEGESVYDRLNLINKNPDTVKFAMKTLKAICSGIGVGEFNDTQELHDKIICIKVRHREHEGKVYPEIYAYSNAVKVDESCPF